MNHKAIYALYPNVVSVDDTAGAKDANGNTFTVYMDAVNSLVDPNAYKFSRVLDYPNIGDQLDALYHAGVFPDDMAAQIQAVKERYPKT